MVYRVVVYSEGLKIFSWGKALFADIMGLIMAKKRNEAARKKIEPVHKPLFCILSNIAT
jgi:hypothetical protein